MAIFHCYVSSPEGNPFIPNCFSSFRIKIGILDDISIGYQHYDAYWWFLMHHAIMTNKTNHIPRNDRNRHSGHLQPTNPTSSDSEATAAPRKRLPRRLYCFFLARARSRRVFPSCRGQKKTWKIGHHGDMACQTGFLHLVARICRNCNCKWLPDFYDQSCFPSHNHH